MFQELSHRVSQLFGDEDHSRRHKDVKFERDIEALVTHFLNKKLYTKTSGRVVEDIEVKQSTAKGKSKVQGTATPLLQKSAAPKFLLPGERAHKSAVVDVMEVGASILNSGKFNEFIHSTAVDPKLGYASKAVFGADSSDGLDELAGEIDNGDGDSSALPGIGGLGGGAYD